MGAERGAADPAWRVAAAGSSFALMAPRPETLVPTEPPVPTKYESADLLLKLYDLRREPMLRRARAWFRERFNPETAQQVLAVYRGKQSAPYRMVTSYWNMAAALALDGAIDEQMFADVNGEHGMVYAKLQPVLEELRGRLGNPRYLQHLEQLILRMPDAQERLPPLRPPPGPPPPARAARA